MWRCGECGDVEWRCGECGDILQSSPQSLKFFHLSFFLLILSKKAELLAYSDGHLSR